VTSSNKVMKILIYLYYALVPLMPLLSYAIAKNYMLTRSEMIVVGLLVNMYILLNRGVFILYTKMICNECSEGKCVELG
jgi:hypothetical protein